MEQLIACRKVLFGGGIVPELADERHVAIVTDHGDSTNQRDCAGAVGCAGAGSGTAYLIATPSPLMPPQLMSDAPVGE